MDSYIRCSDIRRADPQIPVENAVSTKDSVFKEEEGFMAQITSAGTLKLTSTLECCTISPANGMSLTIKKTLFSIFILLLR